MSLFRVSSPDESVLDYYHPQTIGIQLFTGAVWPHSQSVACQAPPTMYR